MPGLNELMEKFKRKPTDLVGLDVADTEIRAVRMRQSNEEITVVAADLLPPPEFIELVDDEPEEEAAAEEEEAIPIAREVEPLVLPPRLKGRYASLAVTGEQALIKIPSFPGAFDDNAAGKIVESMGLQDPDLYRISYKLISEGHGRSESKVLTVALPEDNAAEAIGLLPLGLPAPFSLEVSGLASMSAFLHGPGAEHEDKAVGVIYFEAKTSTFGLFTEGGVLALIRRFDIGTNSVLDKVQEMLGVDLETAQGIISDGSFDISQPVSEVMEPLIKQLLVSRDFVERREDCTISSIFVSGGLVVSRDSLDEMKSALGMEINQWNPFDALTVLPDAIPPELEGQEWRFAAAVGACLATYEEL